jgi:hypothetical protein
MKRRIRIAAASLMVAAGLIGAVAAPASAAQGGNPADGSCGLGKSVAHEAIADPIGPGASEAATFPPSEAGCTGKG